MGRPEYDPETDRYWDGDRPLPRDGSEARRMGLEFDGATDSWWSGDTRVARHRDIERYQTLTRDGVIKVKD